jgi:hypothetical protein
MLFLILPEKVQGLHLDHAGACMRFSPFIFVADVIEKKASAAIPLAPVDMNLFRPFFLESLADLMYMPWDLPGQYPLNKRYEQ